MHSSSSSTSILERTAAEIAHLCSLGHRFATLCHAVLEHLGAVIPCDVDAVLAMDPLSGLPMDVLMTC